MTIANDGASDHTTFLDRGHISASWNRQTNLLLPSARFTLFALTAIVAGAALAFIT